MRILKFLKVGVAALMAFSACGRSVADNPDPCSAPGVIALPYNLPIYWDRPGEGSFTYRFQIRLATERNPAVAPWGIVLNGGAGAPSIGMEAGKIFPRTFNVIYTDVRGAGCNAGEPGTLFPANALTTEYFSRDVLAVVQYLGQTIGLRSYVLFGVSYGTVHATVMTNIAQREGFLAPSAIVLEGILGHWQINANEVVDYNYQWNHAKTLLPPSVVSAFQASSSPYGIPSSDWMLLLTKTLNDGATLEHRGNSTVFALKPLDTTDQDELDRAIAMIKAEIAGILASIRPDTARVASILHCTETTGSVYTKDLVNGEIVNTGPDKCREWNIPHVRPYDSDAYPVAGIPIYYFEGTRDPNTSPANAYHHFKGQTQTTRTLIWVAAGGHTDLSGTLYQMGCTPAIFEAIAMNGTGLRAALDQCRWPMESWIRIPGQ
jgi:pimeloyl-ACP methyl ester carboxylesterase